MSVEGKNTSLFECTIFDCKLILRSLKDMTEKEFAKWESLNIQVKFEDYDYYIEMQNEAKRTAWLTNKRFDPFDLIASGCAIRKPR